MLLINIALTLPWILASWIYEFIAYWLVQVASYVQIKRGRGGAALALALISSTIVLIGLFLAPPGGDLLFNFSAICAITLPVISPRILTYSTGIVDEAWIRRMIITVTAIIGIETGVVALSGIAVRIKPTVPELLLIASLMPLLIIALLKAVKREK